MPDLRFVELDEEAEVAIEALAEAICPHFLDFDRKESVRRTLRRYLKVAWRGPLA